MKLQYGRIIQDRLDGQHGLQRRRLEELARRSGAADVITKHKARPTILAMTEMSVLWDQLRVKGYCELEDGAHR